MPPLETPSSIPDPPPELLAFIREGKEFLLAGHEEPDGDCVGSQLALASALTRLGKSARPCSAGPFEKRPEIRAYQSRFTAPEGIAPGPERVIILDCASPERTGSLEAALRGRPLAVVDHHATASPGAFPPGAPRYVVPQAPAATVLVLALIRALGLAPTPEEAQLLLFGLCTDSGFFRHVGAGSGAAFAAAAELTRLGASPKAVYDAIHGGKSLASRWLLARVLSRARPYYGGKLLVSTEEYEETREFGQDGRDSDSLYQLLQAVEGVEAIVIIRQESPRRCALGFRSRDRVDVGAIAKKFGGGGHKNAAGHIMDGTIADIYPVVLRAFEAVW